MKKLLLIFFLFLTACETTNKITSSEFGIPIKGFLFSDRKPLKGFGAYAYVLFNSKPTNKAEQERMDKFIEAFNRKLPPYNGSGTNYNLMITYWMMNKPALQYGKSISFKTLREDYNYSRAYTMSASIKMLGRRGPVLVVWDTPYEFLVPNPLEGNYFIADLSNFSTDDIDSGIDLWQKILNNGDLNSYSNKFALWLSDYRNILLKYSPDIANIIKNNWK